jgi:membrane peptidoglycan carboxypeptidase
MSRNLGRFHVGARVGFDKVAALWKKVGVGTPPKGFPSITLGVFELTPAEVAQAYTIFMNDGSVRPLEPIDHVQEGSHVLKPPPPKLKRVARPDTTFLVTNMMRSVLNEGTGAPRACRGVLARCRGQERHHERSARCVVRRVHAGTADGRVGRLRR